MGDILRAAVVSGGGANTGSMFDWVTLYDNHGNSTRGYQLTCAGKPSTKMNIEQWVALHDAIEPSARQAWNFNGTIPMLGNMESPLQTMCRKLDAQAHHTSAPRGQPR
jgi:hypothetical protein